jgi:hypothetical protein
MINIFIKSIQSRSFFKKKFKALIQSRSSLEKKFKVSIQPRSSFKKNIMIALFLSALYLNAETYKDILAPGDRNIVAEWSTDDFKFFWNFGSFSGGVNFSLHNDYYFELQMSAGNLFLEHNYTHIGIEINPVQFMWYYIINDRQWIQNIHFLNVNVYWNPLHFENIILGPFIAINTLTQNNNNVFVWDHSIVSTGLRFFWGSPPEKDYRLSFQYIGAEIGYRNDASKHSFYVTVSIDMSIASIAFFISNFGIHYDNQ